MNRCYSCFKEYEEEYDVCPFCGTVKNDQPQEPIYLVPGTVLSNRYIIGEFVGAGGFGVIYKAWDKTLEIVVAVKEFYTSRLMTRAQGNKEVIINKKEEIKQEYEYRKQRFLAEARNMAKFSNHRSIPNVFEYFEENGTAYIVMELLNGQGLNEYLRQSEEKVDRDFAIHVINEVGKALISLHEKGIIHRDVAPDNIYICSDKELKIKLLDLGAASLQDSTDAAIDKILKPGYSPVEQYNDSQNIGAWTDVYALGATLYVMLTGIKPDESTNRKISDTLVPPHELDNSIPENLSNAVMKAMSVDKLLRFKKVEDFLKAINGEKKVMSLAKERKRLKYRRFTGVMTALLAIAAVVVVVVGIYTSKESLEALNDATIKMWYLNENGSQEGAAIDEIISDFNDYYPNVKIEKIEFTDRAVYEEAIKAADSSKTLPALFESTGIYSGRLTTAADVQDILESEQAGECLFLDDYNNVYKSGKKKIPLAIGVPVAYVVTNGKYKVDKGLAANAFSEFFKSENEQLISKDERYTSLLADNDFLVPGNNDKETFLNPGDLKGTAVMYSSTEECNEVEDSLNRRCEWTCVFPNTQKINCYYAYEWSVGSGSEDELAAAKKLLCWMLGANYQSKLMIENENTGTFIPVNKTCFENMCINEESAKIKFRQIGEIYSKFEITQEGIEQ